jgi:hypothetical protein
MTLNPREVLATATIIGSYYEDMFTICDDLLDRLYNEHISGERSALTPLCKKEFPIPDAEFKLPTRVLGTAVPTSDVYPRLQDLCPTAFISLILTKPSKAQSSMKGGSVAFRYDGHANFVRVNGMLFKVMYNPTGHTDKWIVMRVSESSAAICSANSVLFNPIDT